MAFDWNPISTPDSWVNALCWSPTLERLVAGGGGDDSFWYSDDGLTWNIGVVAEGRFIADNGIIWNETLGLFVALSKANVNTNIMTSPDGINWTIRTTPTTGSPMYGLTQIPGSNFMVAIGSGAQCIQSTDGINWVTGGHDLSSLGASTSWKAIIWTGSQFVAIANTGSIRIATSPDGIDWTGRHGFEVDYQKTWGHLAHNGAGLVVAVCDSNGQNLMYSLDGGTVWETPIVFPAVAGNGSRTSKCIIHTTALGGVNGKFLVVHNWAGQSFPFIPQATYIYISEDGINWVADDGLVPLMVASFDGLGSANWNPIVESPTLDSFYVGARLSSLTAIITSLAETGAIGQGGLKFGGSTIFQLSDYTGEGGLVFNGSGLPVEVIGQGGLEFSGTPQIILSVDSSGIYTLARGKRNDTLYTRISEDSTVNVAIPRPFIRSALLGE